MPTPEPDTITVIQCEDALYKVKLHTMVSHQRNNLPCPAGCDGLIVGDENDGDLAACSFFGDQHHGFALSNWIEARGRLISQKNCGADGKRSCQSDALQFTARDIARYSIQQYRIDRQTLQQFDNRRPFYAVQTGDIAQVLPKP